MRQTKHGLTLTYANGEWVTQDGLIAIGRVRALEECENPHPMTWAKEELDLFRARFQGVKQGYCPGLMEHDREIGWDARGTIAGRSYESDLCATLDEAWKTLAKELAK
jgi:hypothetical protein